MGMGLAGGSCAVHRDRVVEKLVGISKARKIQIFAWRFRIIVHVCIVGGCFGWPVLFLSLPITLFYLGWRKVGGGGDFPFLRNVDWWVCMYKQAGRRQANRALDIERKTNGLTI